MDTNQQNHSSFQDGEDLEKDQYHEISGLEDHTDHETSDAHTDHDGSSIDEDREDVEQGPNNLTQPITREKSRASRRSTDLRRSASNVLSAVISRVTTRGWPEPPPPPDGGSRAWLQVACGWIAIFVTWGYLNSFGSFQTYYEQTMPNTDPSVISWIGSLQIWMTMIGGVFTGRLLDAGYFVPTFFVGAVLQVLGIFLMSICTKYWQLMLTQGFLTGLGGGIFFTPALALVATVSYAQHLGSPVAGINETDKFAQYFDKQRGFAMGVLTTGNSVGGMVYPVVVRQLMPKLGFAWTARVLGFINLGALSVCVALMRPRLPPRKSGPLIDWSAFREPVWNVFIVGWWLVMWSNYYTFYYVASYGTQALGLSYSAASVLVIILNGAGLPFRVIVPLFSDRFGPLNVIMPVLAIWSIISFCWLGVSNVPGYYVWTAFYGALSASFQCLIPTSVASITPRLDKVGTRMGMAFGIISFASMTGPPVGGALQTADHDHFTGPQIWAACALLVGFSLCSTARFIKAGRSNLKAKC